MADTDTEYKEKLRKTILTDAGRQVFLSVGNGVGTLVYTRATLSSKKPVIQTELHLITKLLEKLLACRTILRKVNCS